MEVSGKVNSLDYAIGSASNRNTPCPTGPKATEWWKGRFGHLKQSKVTMSQEIGKEWDRDLYKALFAYMVGIQASTNLSPYKVLIGRDMQMSVDNELGSICELVELVDDTQAMQTMMRDKVDSIKEIETYLHDHVQFVQAKNQRSCSARHAHTTPELQQIQNGSLVMMLKLGKKHKLKDPWEGPYRLIRYKDQDTGKEVDKDDEAGCVFCRLGHSKSGVVPAGNSSCCRSCETRRIETLLPPRAKAPKLRSTLQL